MSCAVPSIAYQFLRFEDRFTMDRNSIIACLYCTADLVGVRHRVQTLESESGTYVIAPQTFVLSGWIQLAPLI